VSARGGETEEKYYLLYITVNVKLSREDKCSCTAIGSAWNRSIAVLYCNPRKWMRQSHPTGFGRLIHANKSSSDTPTVPSCHYCNSCCVFSESRRLQISSLSSPTHGKGLQNHINIEASRLLNVNNNTRWLKRNNSLELWRMASSGMLGDVVLVRTDVSEELSAYIIRVTRFLSAKFLRNVGSYKSHTL
jgi:hypothetical protein